MGGKYATALGAAALVLASALTGCAASHPASQPVVHSPAPIPVRPTTTAVTTSPRPTPTHPVVRSTPPRQRATRTRTTTPTPTSASPTTEPVSSPSPSPSSTHRASVVPPSTGARPLVVLDPGHNGGNATHPSQVNRLVYAGYGRTKPCNTTGTSTDAGYPEHAFTWDVALRVRAILAAHHVRVLMTRSNDHGVGPCVNRRAAIESTPGVAAAVAIHADGAPSDDHGFHICEDSRRPEGATRATVHRSHRLSRIIYADLARESGLTVSNYVGHGYYFRDDLAGLNLSTSPTSFLELGNMRNPGDAHLQSTASGRQRIAVAIADGILAYLAAH